MRERDDKLSQQHVVLVVTLLSSGHIVCRNTLATLATADFLLSPALHTLYRSFPVK